MPSSTLKRFAMATFMVAACGTVPAYASHDNSFSPYADMDGVSPLDFLNGTIDFLKQTHVRPHTDDDMRRLLRRSMHEALGPHHKQPKSNRELTEFVLDKIMSNIDPHSAYHNAAEFQRFKEETAGAFGGIGSEVTLGKDGAVKIVKAMENSPSSKAKLQAGDEIIKIDGEGTENNTLNESVSKLRGQIGTSVTLTIRRADTPFFDVSIVRDEVRTPFVTSKLMGDGIGYIKLKSFGETASQEIEDAVNKMEKEQRLRGVILDLRNNPGGLLDQAISVSDLFLDSGPIVSQIGKNGLMQGKETARKGDILTGKPLIVLINGGSASASEITAAALKDNHRATVMGTHSFGKGSVQTMIPLEGLGVSPSVMGGAFRETTALYYGSSGLSPQEIGVIPNIEVKNSWEPKYPVEADEPNVIPNPDKSGADIKPDHQCYMSSAINSRPVDDQVYKIMNDIVLSDTVLLCAIETLSSKRDHTVTVRLPEPTSFTFPKL